MRRRCKILFSSLILGVFFAPSLSAQKPDWRTVEQFTYDWNGRGPTRFTLQIPNNWNDPGQFTRIRIQVPGEKPFSVSDSNGFVSVVDKDSWVPPFLVNESRQMTKEYNLKRYVWAGPDCSETVGVELLPGKRPKLVKIE